MALEIIDRKEVNSFVANVFQLFDVDKNKRLNFEEFTLATTAKEMGEMPGDKLEWLFENIYDKVPYHIFIKVRGSMLHSYIFFPRGRSHSRPVVITIFTQSVRPSVPKLQNQATLTAGRDCGLAEWIIDDSCFVIYIFTCYVSRYARPNFSLFTRDVISNTFMIGCVILLNHQAPNE